MTKISKNLIYFIFGVVIFVGILIYGIYLWQEQQTEPISFTVTLLGSDYNNAVEEVYLSGFQIVMRNIKGGKEKLLLTDDFGKAIFNVKANSSYNLIILPSGTTSFLYAVPPSNLVFNFDIIKDVKKQFRLALKEEATRDIQRRKDLNWVYMPALEQFKNKNGYYPKIVFEKIDSKGELAKILSGYIPNIPLDPLSGHFYEYYSDGKTYKLIAYPEIDFRGNLFKLYKDQKVYLIGNNLDYVSYSNIVEIANKINFNYLESLTSDVAKFIFSKTKPVYAAIYYDGGGGKCQGCQIGDKFIKNGETYCPGTQTNCQNPTGADVYVCSGATIVNGCLIGDIWCYTCIVKNDGSCTWTNKCTSGKFKIKPSEYCSGCQSASCGQCSTVETCTTSSGELGGWRCNCGGSVGGGLYENCGGVCDISCVEEGEKLRCIVVGGMYQCKMSTDVAYSLCASDAKANDACGCPDYNDPGKGGLYEPCTSCGCRNGLYCCPTDKGYACYPDECGTPAEYKCNVCDSNNKCKEQTFSEPCSDNCDIDNDCKATCSCLVCDDKTAKCKNKNFVGTKCPCDDSSLCQSVDQDCGASVNITCAPDTINSGQSLNISYSSQNIKAGTCLGSSADNIWDGVKPDNGMDVVNITNNTASDKNYNFNFQCEDIKGNPVSGMATCAVRGSSQASVYCVADPLSQGISLPVKWTAIPSGFPASCASSSDYIWTWGGAASGDDNPTHESYSGQGTKTATIIATCGGKTASKASCDVQIGQCLVTATANPEIIPSGQNQTVIDAQIFVNTSKSKCKVRAENLGHTFTQSLASEDYIVDCIGDTGYSNCSSTITVTKTPSDQCGCDVSGNKTCTSGGTGVSCSISEDCPLCGPTVSCSVPSSAPINASVNWKIVIPPNNCIGSPTYSWQDVDSSGSNMNGEDGVNVSKSYSTRGTRKAKVTVTCSNGSGTSSPCAVTIQAPDLKSKIQAKIGGSICTTTYDSDNTCTILKGQSITDVWLYGTNDGDLQSNNNSSVIINPSGTSNNGGSKPIGTDVRLVQGENEIWSDCGNTKTYTGTISDPDYSINSSRKLFIKSEPSPFDCSNFNPPTITPDKLFLGKSISVEWSIPSSLDPDYIDAFKENCACFAECNNGTEIITDSGAIVGLTYSYQSSIVDGINRSKGCGINSAGEFLWAGNRLGYSRLGWIGSLPISADELDTYKAIDYKNIYRIRCINNNRDVFNSCPVDYSTSTPVTILPIPWYQEREPSTSLNIFNKLGAYLLNLIGW